MPALIYQASQQLQDDSILSARLGVQGDLIPQARLSGPMPWVIAIMVAMTAIALAAGLALGNAVSVTRAEIEGGVTVQIVEPRSEMRTSQTAKAVAVLQRMGSVESVRSVPQSELDALIEPWLGTSLDGGNTPDIPVPALIDVRLKGAADPQVLAHIERHVRPVAPSARVDAQSGWLRPVFEAMVSLQWLAIAVVALLAVALAAAVLLAARSALGNNRETIEIVHLLGGTDNQVARVFQRSIGRDAAIGGALGLGLAIAILWLMAQRFESLGAGLVRNGSLGWSGWLLLIVVPIFATLLAMLTARLTVLHALRKML